MNIVNKVKEGIVGISLELSTQELIVLKSTIQDLGKVIKPSSKAFRSQVRVDNKSLFNLVTFLGKLTKDAISMQDAHDELFSEEISDEDCGASLAQDEDRHDNKLTSLKDNSA